MFDTFFGLPLHPFIVHATEVAVPLAALLVVLAAAWPRFRRWAGVLPLGVAVAALVLVPISTESGERLQARVGENALIEAHSHLADQLLPWVAGLVVVAAISFFFSIRQRRRAAASAGSRSGSRRGDRWVAASILVVAVVVSAGTTVQAVLVGHSGATAVWSGDMANPAASGGSD